MKITKIQYYLLERKSDAYPLVKCSVIMDDQLKLDGIRVYNGQKGMYVAYPEKMRLSPNKEEIIKDPKFRHKNEFFHPVERDFSFYMERVIIEGYKRLVEQGTLVYYPDGIDFVGVE